MIKQIEYLTQPFTDVVSSLVGEDAEHTNQVTLCDEALLALIVQGDNEALGVLYDRYGRLVFTVALRITGDRETAEEVVQDVFQGVWQSARGFQVGNNTSSWLLGITRHRAIDATRSRRYQARKREESLTFEQPTAEEWDPEHQADVSMLRETVRNALNDLPPMQRQAIELAYYGDLTYVEIANQLGQPLGTVKTRMRLGMQKLRTLFMQTGLMQEREA